MYPCHVGGGGQILRLRGQPSTHNPYSSPAVGHNRSGKLNLFNWHLYNDPEDLWTDERRRNAVQPDIGIVVP